MFDGGGALCRHTHTHTHARAHTHNKHTHLHTHTLAHCCIFCVSVGTQLHERCQQQESEQEQTVEEGGGPLTAHLQHHGQAQRGEEQKGSPPVDIASTHHTSH